MVVSCLITITPSRMGAALVCIFCPTVSKYLCFALSFFVSCCEWLYPSGVSLSGDAMLDLVFAVFLPALGAAIVFDIGASTGGTDIVALILAKYTSMEIGKALMVSDILIVLAAAVRFGMGTGLYCILGLIGKSFVVDGAIENIRLRKVCTIMTANPQPILDFIIHNMNRSATAISPLLSAVSVSCGAGEAVGATSVSYFSLPTLNPVSLSVTYTLKIFA